jgi:hypothetical protein
MFTVTRPATQSNYWHGFNSAAGGPANRISAHPKTAMHSKTAIEGR